MLLKTRSNDTSYSLLAKAVSSATRNVLDLGCGDGNLIEELIDHLPATTEILGIDVSAPEIALAARRFGGIHAFASRSQTRSRFRARAMLSTAWSRTSF